MQLVDSFPFSVPPTLFFSYFSHLFSFTLSIPIVLAHLEDSFSELVSIFLYLLFIYFSSFSADFLLWFTFFIVLTDFDVAYRRLIFFASTENED